MLDHRVLMMIHPKRRVKKRLVLQRNGKQRKYQHLLQRNLKPTHPLMMRLSGIFSSVNCPGMLTRNGSHVNLNHSARLKALASSVIGRRAVLKGASDRML